MHELTPQQKKDYLLKKYTKRDYDNLDDLNESEKFVVYYCPNLQLVKEWTIVCICDTEIEAKKEILWRKHYVKFKDGELITKHDKRFATFHDETKNVDANGNTYEPTNQLMLGNYGGDNLFQVIASETTPAPNPNTGFRGLGHYTRLSIGDYDGFYKIEKMYDVHE
jgi:hypothetical protein